MTFLDNNISIFLGDTRTFSFRITVIMSDEKLVTICQWTVTVTQGTWAHRLLITSYESRKNVCDDIGNIMKG